MDRLFPAVAATIMLQWMTLYMSHFAPVHVYVWSELLDLEPLGHPLCVLVT